MKEPKIYKVKLTALSPVHIGTSEDFELTNYVIDSIISDNKKLYKLFEFDEEDFYSALSNDEKRRFLRLAGGKDIRAVYQFIGKKKDLAKKVSFNQVSVLATFAKEYLEKVGKFVQMEGGNRGVINELAIAKTYTDINTHKPIIPGSSIKGAISTAFQEMIYKNEGEQSLEIKFKNRRMDQNIFRHLQVSDTKILKQGTAIGYAVNRERFEEDDGALSTRVQYINPASEFVIDLKIDEAKDKQKEINFQTIRDSAISHYKPIFDSLFNQDEKIRRLLSPNFLRYENILLKDNQFILRVGKHSGARAVTIDGMRRISVHIRGRGRNAQEETTVWLRGMQNNSTSNMLPFGWLLCELID